MTELTLSLPLIAEESLSSSEEEPKCFCGMGATLCSLATFLLRQRSAKCPYPAEVQWLQGAGIWLRSNTDALITYVSSLY